MVVNSETIEVLVRDRSQPQTVLKSTALTRFVDYTIEPYSKTLLLKAPVSSVDLDLNPQSIRVSYTVDAGGTPFWVGGVDAQYKLRDDLQVGAVLATDNNPNGGASWPPPRWPGLTTRPPCRPKWWRPIPTSRAAAMRAGSNCAAWTSRPICWPRWPRPERLSTTQLHHGRGPDRGQPQARTQPEPHHQVARRGALQRQ
jgi:hypothetical protein